MSFRDPTELGPLGPSEGGARTLRARGANGSSLRGLLLGPAAGQLASLTGGSQTATASSNGLADGSEEQSSKAASWVVGWQQDSKRQEQSCSPATSWQQDE